MTTVPENYAEFVQIGNFTEGERDSQLLVGMGLAGEAGEVCDYLKKVLLHGKPLDRDKLCEELGDVLWYLVLAANVFDMPLEQIARANVEKLCARYPNQYGEPTQWLELEAEDVTP